MVRAFGSSPGRGRAGRAGRAAGHGRDGDGPAVITAAYVVLVPRRRRASASGCCGGPSLADRVSGHQRPAGGGHGRRWPRGPPRPGPGPSSPCSWSWPSSASSARPSSPASSRDGAGDAATIGSALVLRGALLTLLAGVGVLRFDDVFTRMHALTKASTLGVLLALVGAAVDPRHPNDVTSLLLAAASSCSPRRWRPTSSAGRPTWPGASPPRSTPSTSWPTTSAGSTASPWVRPRPARRLRRRRQPSTAPQVRRPRSPWAIMDGTPTGDRLGGKLEWTSATRPRPRPTGRRSRPSWPSTCPRGWQGLGALDREAREAVRRATGATSWPTTACWPWPGPRSTAARAVAHRADRPGRGVRPGRRAHRRRQRRLLHRPCSATPSWHWGTEEQKQHFLPRILSGEDVWCQGYSEPDSGSDLASLATRAVLDGDEWVINGQKIWTSRRAPRPTGSSCCAAPTPTLPKHAGISLPACAPWTSPASRCGPSSTSPGRHDFNEVFFTDARTGQGERDRRGGQRLGRGQHPAGLRAGRRRHRGRHPLPRGAATACVAAARAGAGSTTRSSASASPGPTPRSRSCATWACAPSPARCGATAPGPSPRSTSSSGPSTTRPCTELAVDILGAEALPPSGRDAAFGIAADAVGSPFSARAWVTTFIGARPGTIYSGTSEIQRNIVGERVLGLPASPAWTRVPGRPPAAEGGVTPDPWGRGNPDLNIDGAPAGAPSTASGRRRYDR